MQSTKTIKAVGFGLDGTLYKPSEQVNELIQEYACRKASEVLRIGLEEATRRFYASYSITQSGSQSLVSAGIKDLHTAMGIMQEALENAEVTPYLIKDERLADMLNKLSERYKLFLVTNSPEELSLKKLDALGINKEIFYPRLCGNSPYIREDGTAFFHASYVLDVLMENMMFVGDRESVDILPAKKRDITAAIVNAKSDEADYNLDSIYDLEKILL